MITDLHSLHSGLTEKITFLSWRYFVMRYWTSMQWGYFMHYHCHKHFGRSHINNQKRESVVYFRTYLKVSISPITYTSNLWPSRVSKTMDDKQMVFLSETGLNRPRHSWFLSTPPTFFRWIPPFDGNKGHNLNLKLWKLPETTPI